MTEYFRCPGCKIDHVNLGSILTTFKFKHNKEGFIPACQYRIVDDEIHFTRRCVHDLAGQKVKL